MAKSNLLTATACRNLKVPGMHADGNGLFLNVRATGSKSWLFRYRWQDKRPEIGLGAFPAVSLADAREKMNHYRAMIRQGVDPRTTTVTADTDEPKMPIFKSCAEQFIRDKSAEWKNAKHQEQWTSTLSTYAYPKIGKTPVDQIGLEDVQLLYIEANRKVYSFGSKPPDQMIFSTCFQLPQVVILFL